MKYRLKPTGDFLQIPNWLVEKQIINKQLSHSAFIVFLILYYLHERFNSRVFSYTDHRIKEKFGISGSSMQRARLVLKQIGLIDYRIGFSTKSQAKATKYKLLPDEQIRKQLRVILVKSL